MSAQEKVSRRQQILETLAHELEVNPGERITTAALAKAVGVSEAALYRHFPSKAKMFDGLIEFSEETIFGIINRILEDESDVQARCEKILGLLLGFSAKNPGITRVLLGDALVGETERLRKRIEQFYNRLETQIKQILREAETKQQLPIGSPVNAMASMMLAVVEGRMNQFARSSFQRSPLEEWERQWQMLAKSIFNN